MGVEDTKKDSSGIFFKIIEYCNKYGKHSVTYGLLVFMVYMFILKDIANPIDRKWANVVNKQEIEHNEGLEKRAQADILVPAMLDKLRIRLNTTRISVLEYHNGGNNTANLPFKHFSMTYESIDDRNFEIDYVAEQYRNQMTGDYFEIISQFSGSYISICIEDIETVKDKYPKLYRRVTRNNVKSLFIAQINGSTKPIGFLMITDEVGVLDKNLIETEVMGVIYQLSSRLDGISPVEL